MGGPIWDHVDIKLRKEKVFEASEICVVPVRR
jgi:hypothetical protein